MTWTTEFTKLVCSVEGCGLPIRAKGYCKNHRQRFLKYGRLEKIIGDKTKHSLYRMWSKRKQKVGNFVEEWLNFDAFLTAVGEKPKDHFLARLDENMPCGPNNWEWRKIKLRKLPDESNKEYVKRAVANARILNPTLARASNYKYNFGLTLEKVEKKLKDKNYVCAICEEPETATYKDTNKVRTLSLDHNHTTNQIRDFLCSKCNLFVGKVEKDRTLIIKVEKYLDRWQVQQEIS